MASGTKAGVRTSPRCSESVPVRAREPGSRVWMEKAGRRAARIKSRGRARRTRSQNVGELPQLVVGEVAQEALAHAGEVGRAGAGQHRLARVGEDGEAAAAVGRAGVAHDQAVALEAVDEPRDAGAAQQHAVGELGHAQAPARRGLQVDEHVVGGERQAVGRVELGVELAHEGRVDAQQPAPGPELLRP